MTKTSAPNFVTALLASSGVLKPSFEDVSVDDLRWALCQMIDGLERLDELGAAAEQVMGEWRSCRQVLDTNLDAVLQDELPIIPQMPTDSYLSRAQWMTKGVECDVGLMERADLDLAIREVFVYFDRFRRVGEALARDAKVLLEGTLLQDHGSKLALIEEAAEQRTRKEKRARP